MKQFMYGLAWLAVLQFGLLFLLLPLGLALYLKVDVVSAFRLHLPQTRAWAAAILIGMSSWVIASQLIGLQSQYMPSSEALRELDRTLSSQTENVPVWMVVGLLAMIPAISEEFLFRGFLLSGLGRSGGKWMAIVVAGVIFGVFHFLMDKIPVTALMGILLGYLCWQSASLWPAILAHVLHNGSVMVLARIPRAMEWLGLSNLDRSPGSLLPLRVLLPAVVLLIAGLALLVAMKPAESSTASRSQETPAS